MKWQSIKQSLEGKLRGEAVSSLGRIRGIRKHKHRVFADLTDYTGNIQ
jgi:hypothetical protein